MEIYASIWLYKGRTRFTIADVTRIKVLDIHPEIINQYTTIYHMKLPYDKETHEAILNNISVHNFIKVELILEDDMDHHVVELAFKTLKDGAACDNGMILDCARYYQ